MHFLPLIRSQVAYSDAPMCYVGQLLIGWVTA
jgi:hypothetical protein